MKRILVIQLARMGDLLQVSPLIQGIRLKNPGGHVTLLTSKQVEAFARAIPGADEVIGFDFGQAHMIANDGEADLLERHERFSSLLNGLKGTFFDRVYNLNYSPLNAYLMNVIAYRKSSGYALDRNRRRIMRSPWLGYLFSTLSDRRLSRFNLVDIYLNGTGTRSGQSSLFFRIEGESQRLAGRFLGHRGRGDHERVIGLQMSAGHEVRRWPVEFYRKLVGSLLQKQRARIVLFGGPSEIPLGEAFQAHFDGTSGGPGRRVINLVGRTTLQDVASVLKRCDLLVTPDTGIMHLAAAVGTRVLALFMGSAFYHETGPYGHDHFVLHPGLECYPCFEKDLCMHQKCKNLLSPDLVSRVVEGIWRRKGDGKYEKSFGPFPSDVGLLRSEMTPHGVDYIPIGEVGFTLEDAVSYGYRAMWPGVLDGRWRSPESTVRRILRNLEIRGDPAGPACEVRGLGREFERLEGILEAHASLPSIGSGTPARWLERLADFLDGETEKGARWTRPMTRFFRVVYEDLKLSGRAGDIRARALVRRLTVGAAFMKTVCRALVSTLLS